MKERLEVSFTVSFRQQTAGRGKQSIFQTHAILPTFATSTLPQPQLEIMAKDEVYELAVAKGSRLLRMMLTNDSEAGPLLQPPQNTAQSVFTSAQDLAKYGYTQLPWDPRVGEGALDGLAPAFEAIGVDAKLDQDEGKNVVVDHKHSQACTIDGIQYRVSNYHPFNTIFLLMHRLLTRFLPKFATPQTAS